MARTITFTVSDATVAVTGTTYTFLLEKDWDFLLRILSDFKKVAGTSDTVELTIYTDNTATTTKIARYFSDLD